MFSHIRSTADVDEIAKSKTFVKSTEPVGIGKARAADKRRNLTRSHEATKGFHNALPSHFNFVSSCLRVSHELGFPVIEEAIECRGFLIKYGIDFDERYVLDYHFTLTMGSSPACG